MTPVRITSKDGITAQWGGVRGPHDLAAPARGAIATPRDSATAGGGLLRAGLRFLRNAAIGLSLLVAVPIVAVGTSDMPRYDWTHVRQRLADVEHLRTLVPAPDPSITPLQAGLSFRALQLPPAKGQKPPDDFPRRAVVLHGEGPWRTVTLAPDVFGGMDGPVSRISMSANVLERLPGGISSGELAYLRAVAEAPHWADFEVIAHAPAVDLIGGQFVVPFSDDAFAPAMPIMRYAETRELANAAIVRAAYYAAIGQPARAEAALRSIVSFGFALIDNGSSVMDALIGRVIVDMGRNALHQWSAIAHDSRLHELTVPLPKRRATPALRMRTGSAETPEAIMATANDPDAPRALQLETLRQLSFSTCGSVRGMLLGPSGDVVATFDAARRSLARYPSERAFLDILQDATNRLPEDVGGPRGIVDRLGLGAATVAGIVLNNPRLPACTRLGQAFD